MVRPPAIRGPGEGGASNATPSVAREAPRPHPEGQGWCPETRRLQWWRGSRVPAAAGVAPADTVNAAARVLTGYALAGHTFDFVLSRSAVGEVSIHVASDAGVAPWLAAFPGAQFVPASAPAVDPSSVNVTEWGGLIGWGADDAALAWDPADLLAAVPGVAFTWRVHARPLALADIDALLADVDAEIHDFAARADRSRDASRSLSVEYASTHGYREVDRSAQRELDWREDRYERLLVGRAIGAWDWAALLACPDGAAERFTQVLGSALVGRTHAERPLSVRPSAVEGRNLMAVRLAPGRSDGRAIVHSEELAQACLVPHRSLPGFGADPRPAFATAGGPVGSQSIALGEILDRGRPSGSDLRVGLNAFSQHALVVGMTGAGKTNSVMRLLTEARTHGVPFLIIEPAKQEYRALGRCHDDLRVYTLGNQNLAPFRLNPFACPSGFALATHVDYLKSLLTSMFSMSGPFPHVIEELVIRAYEKRGWDLVDGTCRHERILGREACFPTIGDLVDDIDAVVDAVGYGSEIRQNIRGAVRVRLRSLQLGAKGHMLNTRRSVPWDDLLARPTVLELASLGDDQEKALLMGLILVGLYEHRAAENSHSSATVHLTVIEEAHRVLKRSLGSGDPEAGNPATRAVEMFNHILSEIRAYGEGLVISEQIPAKLTPDALKNTGLKVVHRVQAPDDREELAGCMVLNDEQSMHLARLYDKQAVVFGGGAREAVLIRVADSKPQFDLQYQPVTDAEIGAWAAKRSEGESSALMPMAGCGACRAVCRRVRDAAALAAGHRRVAGEIADTLLGALGPGSTAQPSDHDEFCIRVQSRRGVLADIARAASLPSIEVDLAEAEWANSGSAPEGRLRGMATVALDKSKRAVCRDCRFDLCTGFIVDRELAEPDIQRLVDESRFREALRSPEARAAYRCELESRMPGSRQIAARLAQCLLVRFLSRGGGEVFPHVLGIWDRCVPT